MGLLQLLSCRRSAGEAIEREATQLIMFLGDMAYDEARSRARACRDKGDRSGARLWSQVAVTIAKRTGYEIGLKAADRYERDRRLEGSARARRTPDIAANTSPILSTLAAIARGRNVETGLHNVSACVRNAVGLAKQNAAVSAAAEEVCRAAARLAAGENEAANQIESGIYPPALEDAAKAVERLRVALTRAHSLPR